MTLGAVHKFGLRINTVWLNVFILFQIVDFKLEPPLSASTHAHTHTLCKQATEGSESQCDTAVGEVEGLERCEDGPVTSKTHRKHLASMSSWPSSPARSKVWRSIFFFFQLFWQLKVIWRSAQSHFSSSHPLLSPQPPTTWPLALSNKVEIQPSKMEWPPFREELRH